MIRNIDINDIINHISHNPTTAVYIANMDTTNTTQSYLLERLNFSDIKDKLSLKSKELDTLIYTSMKENHIYDILFTELLKNEEIDFDTIKHYIDLYDSYVKLNQPVEINITFLTTIFIKIRDTNTLLVNSIDYLKNTKSLIRYHLSILHACSKLDNNLSYIGKLIDKDIDSTVYCNQLDNLNGKTKEYILAKLIAKNSLRSKYHALNLMITFNRNIAGFISNNICYMEELFKNNHYVFHITSKLNKELKLFSKDNSAFIASILRYLLNDPFSEDSLEDFQNSKILDIFENLHWKNFILNYSKEAFIVIEEYIWQRLKNIVHIEPIYTYLVKNMDLKDFETFYLKSMNHTMFVLKALIGYHNIYVTLLIGQSITSYSGSEAPILGQKLNYLKNLAIYFTGKNKSMINKESRKTIKKWTKARYNKKYLTPSQKKPCICFEIVV